MAERNQLGRPPGGHDPGEPRHRQHVPFAAPARVLDVPREPDARSTSLRVSRFILTAAEAVAARAVSGLAATSTIRAAPARVDVRQARFCFHSTVTLLARLRG